ncbi:hypothetical protein PS385_09110 [Limosilactobacillus fermentum]|uniref:hypothetical protein n=1 Tax=Limosilactobacillus fermentum TaxID=1613 RepID=UPI002F266D4C
MARKSIAERLAALKEQERKLHQEADRELVKVAHKVGIMLPEDMPTKQEMELVKAAHKAGIMSAKDMPTKHEMELLKKQRNYLAKQTTDQTYDRESEN